MTNIYAEMMKAGVPIANHESDLYVPVTEESKKIITNYDFKSSVRQFKNNLDGKMWYDIPFAYIPWWTSRQQ